MLQDGKGLTWCVNEVDLFTVPSSVFYVSVNDYAVMLPVQSRSSPLNGI